MAASTARPWTAGKQHHSRHPSRGRMRLLSRQRGLSARIGRSRKHCMAGLRRLPCQHLPGRRACSRLRLERSRSNGCLLGALLRWHPLQRKTRMQSILPAQPLQSMPKAPLWRAV